MVSDDCRLIISARNIAAYLGVQRKEIFKWNFLMYKGGYAFTKHFMAAGFARPTLCSYPRLLDDFRCVLNKKPVPDREPERLLIGWEEICVMLGLSRRDAWYYHGADMRANHAILEFEAKRRNNTTYMMPAAFPSMVMVYMIRKYGRAADYRINTDYLNKIGGMILERAA